MEHLKVVSIVESVTKFASGAIAKGKFSLLIYKSQSLWGCQSATN